ncbi:hypothetical protein ACTFIU_006088 [Dictyostelium citrinum]
MIEDFNELTPIYREKYKLTVLPKWRKKLVILKMILLEIIFLIQITFRTIKSILFYFFTHKKGYIIKDIKYGPNDRNQCDIYIPSTSNYLLNNKKDLPVVIFMHGGSWGFGHKLQYILLGKKLSDRGIVTMVINYRLTPKGNIDDMLEDIDNATSFCYENIENYGGDKNKIYLMGHSAGGHIISQYVVVNYSKPTIVENDNSQPKNNKKRVPLSGVFPLSAPLHINDHFLFETQRGVEHISPMRPAMKGPKYFDQYSPSAVLEKIKDKSIRDDKLPTPFPSFYILHGVDDATVPLSSSTKFFSILMRKLANPTARTLFLKAYPKIKHIDLIFNVCDDNLIIERNIFNGIDDDDINNNNNDNNSSVQSILNDMINIIKY